MPPNPPPHTEQAAPALTKAEIESWLIQAELGALNVEERATFIGWVTGEIGSISADLEPALFAELRRQITREASARTIENARRLAQRQTRRIAADIVRSELNKIGGIIAQALKDGAHPFEVARRLDMVKSLDSGRAASLGKYRQYLEGQGVKGVKLEERVARRREKLLRDRRKTIAQTEMRFATSEANRIKAEGRAQEFKAWFTAGQARVCAICQGNEVAGWIPIKKSFPSGHQMTPAHPACRCTNSYRTEKPDKDALDRVEQRVERTAIATATAG